MEHDQLIGEMSQIERLTTAERLRLARLVNTIQGKDKNMNYSGNDEVYNLNAGLKGRENIT